MTREDKELLLKDLCGRLPYGVMCYCKWNKDAPNGTKGYVQELSTFLIDEIEIMDNPEYDCQICDVKPYLRKMSSMTNEEWEECHKIEDRAHLLIDWFNAHYFDYRGLIDKGLALEALEGMYNIKNK